MVKETHAPAGGECRLETHRCYSGGEFLPFYIPRAEMPQVDEDYVGLYKFLKSKGVDSRLVEKDPHELLNHQRVTFDVSKFQGNPDRLVLTSQDGYILDGNHRVEWHRYNGGMVKCLEIGCDFDTVYGLLFQFGAHTSEALAKGE